MFSITRNRRHTSLTERYDISKAVDVAKQMFGSAHDGYGLMLICTYAKQHTLHEISNATGASVESVFVSRCAANHLTCKKYSTLVNQFVKSINHLN